MINATFSFKSTEKTPPPPTLAALLPQIDAVLTGAPIPCIGIPSPVPATGEPPGGNISPNHRSSKSSIKITAPRTSSRSRSIALPRLSRAATVPGRVARSSATCSIVYPSK